jgi:hypothetical protein
MSFVRPYLGTPRVEDQHEDVFPGSPMAVVAVFTNCLQARFSGDNAYELPYRWSEDPQPEESGAVKLYIESQYTEEPDARNRTPALLVEKGATQLQKMTIGHRGFIDMPTMREVFAAWAYVPISVLCLANNRGVSATLADTVFAFLVGSTNHIREAFSIHEISPPTISDTQPYRQSSDNVEVWTTTVSVTTMIKYMWQTRPIAPVLREIAAKMTYGNTAHELTALDLRRR